MVATVAAIIIMAINPLLLLRMIILVVVTIRINIHVNKFNNRM